jgi:NACHT domain
VSHCVVITDRCPSVLTFCSAMSSMNLNTANLSGSTFNSIGGHQINISLTNCVAGVTQSCFCYAIQLNIIHTPLDNYRLLSPANAGIDRIGPVARCHDGTREVLIARIKQWIDQDPIRPICWLHGPAGSGKSAVAQTVGEYCQAEERLAASFFFFRGVENRSTIVPLVSTLAYQLLTSIPATKPLLQNVLRTDPFMSQRALSHQFKKLMLEPILEAETTPRAPTVVILDALDECSDTELMAEFLEVVIDACRTNHAFPFRVFLTSRVESHLRRRLESHAAQSIVYLLDLRHFDASNDIRKFFHSRFSTIYGENQWCMREISWPWPLDSEVDALVNWASGSFLRAAEFTNLLNDGINAPHQTLQVALRAITNPPSRHRLSLSGLVRRFLPSSSGQTAIAVGSAPISSMSPTLLENHGVSGITSRAETEYLYRAQTRSSASMLSNIPDLQQVSRAQSGPSIELVSLESLIGKLITDFSCGPISLQFCHLFC